MRAQVSLDLLFTVIGVFAAICISGCSPKLKYEVFHLDETAGVYRSLTVTPRAKPEGTDTNTTTVSSKGAEVTAPRGAIDFFMRDAVIVVGEGKPDGKADGAQESKDVTSLIGNISPVRGRALLFNAWAIGLQQQRMALKPITVDKKAFLSTPLAATVVPTEDRKALFRATPNEVPILFQPNVSVTYLSNTALLSSIGAHAQENVSKTIGVVTSIVAATATIAAEDKTACLKPPFVLPVPRSRSTGPNWSRHEVLASSGDGQTAEYNGCVLLYRFTPVRSWLPSESIDDFMKRNTGMTREVPYQPCEDVVLELAVGTSPKDERPTRLLKALLRVPQVDRVRSYLLPSKGKISLHEVCFADLEAESTPGSEVLEMSAAFANLVSEIRGGGKPTDPGK